MSRPAHRLFDSRSWMARTGTTRCSISSNAPRISEMSSSLFRHRCEAGEHVGERLTTIALARQAIDCVDRVTWIHWGLWRQRAEGPRVNRAPACGDSLTRACEPNRVPPRLERKTFENVVCSNERVVMVRLPRGVASARKWRRRSLFKIGHGIPIFIAEPRQVSIEHDRAAIADRVRAHANDRASQYSTAQACSPALTLHLKLHAAARQQSMLALDQHAAGRDIDQRHRNAGPNSSPDDAVLLHAAVAASCAPVASSNRS